MVVPMKSAGLSVFVVPPPPHLPLHVAGPLHAQSPITSRHGYQRWCLWLPPTWHLACLHRWAGTHYLRRTHTNTHTRMHTCTRARTHNHTLHMQPWTSAPYSLLLAANTVNNFKSVSLCVLPLSSYVDADDDGEHDPAWASGGSDAEGDRAWDATGTGGVGGGALSASHSGRFKASVLLTSTGVPVVPAGETSAGGSRGGGGGGRADRGRKGKPLRRGSKGSELLGPLRQGLP
jgi:hypothetical protein